MGKRSLWLVGVAAVAAALWMAPPAHAWFLPGAPGGALVEVGIEDVSEWFHVDMNPGGAADLRWEMRTAFDVTGLKAGSTASQTSQVPELTGLMYDLELVGYTTPDSDADLKRDWVWMPAPIAGNHAANLASLQAASVKGNVAYMAPLGRNPVPAGVGGPGGTSGGGGVLEIYSDPNDDMVGIENLEGGNFVPQPGAWGAGTGPGGRDGLVTFTEGTLDIQGVFMPLSTMNANALLIPPFFAGIDPYATDVSDGAIPAFKQDGVTPLNLVWMEEIAINPWQASTANWGDAYGYMEVLAGASMYVVEPFARFPGCDVDIHSNLAMTGDEVPPSPAGWIETSLGSGVFTALDKWDNASRDPTKYVAQPEPASLLVWALMGLGSAGYGIRKRRRMRKS